MANYQGKYAIKIGDGTTWKDTWIDWRLIPANVPTVAIPQRKTNEIEIPGVNGKFDILDLLVGGPVYSNSTGSWDFFLDPDRDEFINALTDPSDPRKRYTDFNRLVEDVIDFVHGRERRVILTDDPDYYYVGRMTVSKAAMGDKYGSISFGYDFLPFKRRVVDNSEVTSVTSGHVNEGVIQPIRNVPVVAGAPTTYITVTSYGNPTSPRIFTTLPVSCTFGGWSYPLNAGFNQLPAIQLSPGLNTFGFNVSNATEGVTAYVSIEF